MKKIAAILVVAAAIAAVWWWWRSSGGRKADAPPGPAASVKTWRGELVLTVDATGSVVSNQDIEIKCKASGEVVSLPYDVGDRVPGYVSGQNEDKALLAALDPTDENRRVQRAETQAQAAKARVEQMKQAHAMAQADLDAAGPRVAGNIAAAQARADLAGLSLKRKSKLKEEKILTDDEWDAAEAEAKVAAAQLRIAQAEEKALRTIELTVGLRKAEWDLAAANEAAAEVDLADARQRQSETRIYSPIDGVVTSRTAQTGQIVASGILNVAGGTTLLTVSDLSRVFVVAMVNESDVGRLVETGRLGQEAAITTDTYPGKRFAGRVVQLTPRGRIDSKVVFFAVKVEVLSGGKDLLLPEMSADVSILAERRTGVLVPNTAIEYDRDRPYVNVLVDGKPRRRDVSVGLSDGINAEITAGLGEGEEVAVSDKVRTSWSGDGRPAAATLPASGPEADR